MPNLWVSKRPKRTKWWVWWPVRYHRLLRSLKAKMCQFWRTPTKIWSNIWMARLCLASPRLPPENQIKFKPRPFRKTPSKVSLNRSKWRETKLQVIRNKHLERRTKWMHRARMWCVWTPTWNYWWRLSLPSHRQWPTKQSKMSLRDNWLCNWCPCIA